MLRTHIRCSLFSSPSDLMKSTVVDESLSTTTTRVLARENYSITLRDDRMRNLHKMDSTYTGNIASSVKWVGKSFLRDTILQISLSEECSCEGATVVDKWSWEGATALLEWSCKGAILMIGFAFCCVLLYGFGVLMWSGLLKVTFWGVLLVEVIVSTAAYVGVLFGTLNSIIPNCFHVPYDNKTLGKWYLQMHKVVPGGSWQGSYAWCLWYNNQGTAVVCCHMLSRVYIVGCSAFCLRLPALVIFFFVNSCL